MTENSDTNGRYELVNELHARPFQSISGPQQISHFAFRYSGKDPAADRDHLAALCRRFGGTPPPDDASHHVADLGKFRVKWEKHTEFGSYTFFSEGPFETPFVDPPGAHLPEDWLNGSPGDLIVALHIAVEDGSSPERSPGAIEKLFMPAVLVSSRIAHDTGQLWTDFRLHEDGFGRVYVRNEGMRPPQAGRLIQRIIEIETYYLLALLALPIARETSEKLQNIDGSLAHLTFAMGHGAGNDGIDDETGLLNRLTRLSAEIETLATTTAFRFGASGAYYALVQARVAELREERIEGFQTLQEFLERRLAPAMRTCESVAERIADLSRRATRTANLMRTRVDVSIQAQNQGSSGQHEPARTIAAAPAADRGGAVHRGDQLLRRRSGQLCRQGAGKGGSAGQCDLCRRRRDAHRHRDRVVRAAPIPQETLEIPGAGLEGHGLHAPVHHRRACPADFAPYCRMNRQ